MILVEDLLYKVILYSTSIVCNITLQNLLYSLSYSEE